MEFLIDIMYSINIFLEKIETFLNENLFMIIIIFWFVIVPVIAIIAICAVLSISKKTLKMKKEETEAFSENSIVKRVSNNFADVVLKFLEMSIKKDMGIEEKKRRIRERTLEFKFICLLSFSHINPNQLSYSTHIGYINFMHSVTSGTILDFEKENLKCLNNNIDKKRFFDAVTLNIDKIIREYASSRFKEVEYELEYNCHSDTLEVSFKAKTNNEFYVAPKDWM